jgi:peptidoglycan hydrolase-like protein with peptidoglycan-binding domain
MRPRQHQDERRLLPAWARTGSFANAHTQNVNTVASSVAALVAAGTILLVATPAYATSSDPILRPGDRGGEVAIWQATLNVGLRHARGPHPLIVDGVFGPLTERATRRFQKTFHQRQTGVVREGTWKAWLGAHTTPGCTFLRAPLVEGEWSPCVGWWQIVLNRWLSRHDPDGPRLFPDGVFGPLTEAATLRFQRGNRIAADGIVGPQTWHAGAGLVHF